MTNIYQTLKNAYSTTSDYVRRNAPIVRNAIANEIRIIRETTTEAREEIKNERETKTRDNKDYEKFMKTMAEGPQRFQSRLDELAQEGRQLQLRRDVRVGISGGAIVTQELIAGNEMRGYIVDPISGKAKRYTMRYTGNPAREAEPVEAEVI